ncbi:hypothetical protein [Pandoraea sp.]|uniref:hypothetical protein n=1 Tax=Pandoraea sp. TaxID=1883445 RepID=UPI0011F9DDE4|nr:hypothetical protein [Pandoraea sp.]TAL55283.1 MAG: hypothetical protein EPN80_08010 [Pandoraea sp.]TAM18201.1 MAG: hypothetical protein EPN65_07880 [Pandoraea sp.]
MDSFEINPVFSLYRQKPNELGSVCVFAVPDTAPHIRLPLLGIANLQRADFNVVYMRQMDVALLIAVLCLPANSLPHLLSGKKRSKLNAEVIG